MVLHRSPASPDIGNGEVGRSFDRLRTPLRTQYCKQNLPSANGTGGSSRGTTQVNRPSTSLNSGRFALRRLTSASLVTLGLRLTLLCGARWHLALRSPERLKRELQLGSDECKSQRYPCTSLAASASLLSSVIAFEMDCCNYLRKWSNVKACTMNRMRNAGQRSGMRRSFIQCYND